MKDALIAWALGLPPEIATMLLSALPVTEMRVGLPVALTVFQLPAASAIFFALLGNLLPIPFLLILLPIAIRASERVPGVKKLTRRYFDYLKRKHTDQFEKVGAAALGAVAVLPLPGAGIWTGCILAVLFQIRPRYSVPSLVVGAAFEALIIFLITEGTLGALSFLL